MSNPTLATKVTRKLKQVPSRLTADMCRYLHSDALSSPPTGYQEMINQVTEMLEKMQDLKELSAFCDRFEEAQDEYIPSYASFLAFRSRTPLPTKIIATHSGKALDHHNRVMNSVAALLDLFQQQS